MKNNVFTGMEILTQKELSNVFGGTMSTPPPDNNSGPDLPPEGEFEGEGPWI